MKFVAPGAAPDELTEWIQQRNQAGQSIHFDNLNHVEINGVKRDPKAAVLTRLVQEQGHICPYTLMGIQPAGIDANGVPIPATAHIEHIVARSRSDEAKTVEYTNLIACYPKGGKVEYGAHARGNTDLVIDPRVANCESYFEYRDDGKVYAQANSLPPPAVDDVSRQIDNTLRLNHPTLERLRLAALREMGLTFDANIIVIEPVEADRLADEMQKRDLQGKFRPFCLAISQVAAAWALRLRAVEAGQIT